MSENQSYLVTQCVGGQPGLNSEFHASQSYTAFVIISQKQQQKELGGAAWCGVTYLEF